MISKLNATDMVAPASGQSATPAPPEDNAENVTGDATTSPNSTPLAAALWDFDGTLADTEPLWVAAEFELVDRLGGEWNLEHAHKLVGNALLDSGAYILKTIGRTDLTPAWVVDQLLNRVVDQLMTGNIPWRPGALELLKSFNDAGIPCALVSASYRKLLDAALAQLPEGSFQTSVGGDEVSQGKPHPEAYLVACTELGVEPRDCVVFEDSATGARAGNAAGALVIGVHNLVTIPEAPNRLHIDSMNELDADRVVDLLNSWHGA